MFNAEKKIPKSLKDCFATDNVSTRLWYWADRLEIWGRRCLIFMIVKGIIETIAVANEVSSMSNSYVFITIISSLLASCLYAFLVYLAYRTLSLLVASLASLVQNTLVTANVALYGAAKKEGMLSKLSSESSSSSQSTGFPLSDSSFDESSWICSSCGTKNESGKIYCKDCGKYK